MPKEGWSDKRNLREGAKLLCKGEVNFDFPNSLLVPEIMPEDVWFGKMEVGGRRYLYVSVRGESGLVKNRILARDAIEDLCVFVRGSIL